MPQPSGQVLVDSGHALAGTLFAYAHDNGGGVVQVAVDNPDAPGTYQVRTQLQTAGGRRKTGAISVEVLA